MRRMIALVLVVALLCGILQTSGYATPNDPSESDSTVVIKDVLLREEFTFTDHNGNVSEPQVLCRREYDVRGRLTRIIDDTGLVKGWDENDEYTFYHTRSFGDIFQPPINYLKKANELELYYKYDGELHSIVYYVKEGESSRAVKVLPVLDTDGRILSQTIPTDGVNSVVNYTYNDAGAITRILSTAKVDTQQTDCDELNYEYSSEGLLVRESSLSYGSTFWSLYDTDTHRYEDGSWERTYSYDDYGHLVSGTYTYHTWTSALMNYWINSQFTDQYYFTYTGGRLTQVTVQCGDWLYLRNSDTAYNSRYASYTVDLIYGDYNAQPSEDTSYDSYLDVSLMDKPSEAPSAENDLLAYEITATVLNSATASARSVDISISLPSELQLMEGETVVKTLGEIAVEEQKTVSWYVYAEKPPQNTAAYYSVSITIDAAADLAKNAYIYLTTEPPTDNTLIVGVDTWNFLNRKDVFGSGNYYLSDTDLSALMENLTYTERLRAAESIYRNWNGSCFGMSTTVILSKMGVLHSEEIQKGTTTLYDVQKAPTDDNVESLINFYQLMQATDKFILDYADFSYLSTREQIKQLEIMAARIPFGGTPILILIDEPSHALVGYKLEQGNFPLPGNKNKTYDSRILIYDCNNLDDPEITHLYFNSGTDDWSIPGYSKSRIVSASSDLKAIDNINYKVATEDYISRLTFEGEASNYYLLRNKEEILIDKNYCNKEDRLVVFPSFDVPADDNDESGEFSLILPENAEDCTVKPAEGSSMFTMFYKDLAIKTDCDEAEKITFHPSGDVTAIGTKGAYSLMLVCNKGTSPLGWYSTTIRGNDGGNVSLSRTEDGIVVSGDNMKDVCIEIKGEECEQEIIIPTSATSIILMNGKDDDPAEVRLDTDGDGLFETEYNSQTEPPTEEKNESKLNVYITLTCIIVLMLSVVAILFVNKKRKNTK